MISIHHLLALLPVDNLHAWKSTVVAKKETKSTTGTVLWLS